VSNSLAILLPPLSVTSILLCDKSFRVGIDSHTSELQFQFSINQNSISNEYFIQYKARIPSNLTFEIYSMEGKLINSMYLMQASEGSVRIGTEELHNGCYFVRMKSGQQSITKKFIVLR
jgi:hypothetical protein